LQRISSLRHATLVAFAALNGRLFIWVADTRGIQEFNLAVGPNQLAEEVRIFSTLCSDSRSSLEETKTHGRQLYNWLVAPIEENIRGQTILLIETDGLLSGLAWPALVSRQGKYLGQSHAIAGISGLRRGPMSPEAFSDPIKRVLVAIPGATSSASSRYQPLPNAEVEAKAILALYPNFVCLRNRDVSVDRLLKELPTASIFHFAGHAQTREYGGALVLSGASSPETLSSRELAQLRLPRCRLVVLSACATATAEQDVVRDPNGLVRSFLAAGASNVIASHWEVDSKATAELMVSFYRQYRGNKAPVEALQLAMNYMRSQTATAHPYYWASFELFAAAGTSAPPSVRPSAH
jgi:CHAT domain-containing protein